MIHIILEKRVMGHESWPSPIEAPPAPDTDADASVTHRTFFELAVGNKPLGKVVFGLFGDALPKTVENFRALCAGDKVHLCCKKKQALLPVTLGYKGIHVQQLCATWLRLSSSITVN